MMSFASTLHRNVFRSSCMLETGCPIKIMHNDGISMLWAMFVKVLEKIKMRL